MEADFPTTGYIVPSFTNTLIGVGPICDTDCAVIFTKKDVTVLSPKVKAIITGWREKKMPRLWHFTLKPTENLIKDYTTTIPTTPAVHSAYDLPSVEALLRYMHASAGLPVKYTWLKAIKKEKFATWPGLTYSNTEKYCPHAVETIKGHMVQSSQGVQSTNKNKHRYRGIKKAPVKATIEKEYEREDILTPLKTKELHIWNQPISKLYTDDCGRFPIISRNGNEYIIIAHHCDTNTILQYPFFNRKYKHSIREQNFSMRRLADRGHQVDFQILDNEVSTDFKRTIVEDWCATYQLVPPNFHRINIAERAIYTFKAHFYQCWLE